MPKNERVEFADTGDWWEFRTYLPVALERDYIKQAIDSQETLTNFDPDLIAKLAARMDGLVVRSTVGWSYGAVDIETLHNDVPAHHYHQVSQRMSDLYSPLVMKSIEAGLSNYTSLLNSVNSESQQNLKTPT